MSGSFFPYLSLAEEYFKAHGQRATYKKRQLLVRHDEPSQWIFFLRSGLIKVAYTLDDGTERLMGYFVPGMVFAQLGALFPDSLSGMEYEASLNTEVYRLPRQEFFGALTRDIEMSQEYLEAMLKIQVFLIERLEYQGEKGMRQKYLKWLLFVMRYYGRVEGSTCFIVLPLTQTDIANFLLATRESASKVTNQFIRQGLIRIENHHVVIQDVARLKKLAGK